MRSLKDARSLIIAYCTPKLNYILTNDWHGFNLNLPRCTEWIQFIVITVHLLCPFSCTCCQSQAMLFFFWQEDSTSPSLG